MGKIKMPPKRNKKTKLTPVRIILISSFLALVIGVTFAIFQFIGEYFGFFPVISIGTLDWGYTGDPIIVYVVGLLTSIFIGSIVVMFIVRNQY
jgi:hypothetical protein